MEKNWNDMEKNWSDMEKNWNEMEKNWNEMEENRERNVWITLKTKLHQDRESRADIGEGRSKRMVPHRTGD